ncbi:MAG TPA: hypothetical protein GX707_09440 [Epulopiscium sp.]|nr:hypothetical protein [Candidatus Epulonipiscium sp.]
MNSKEHLICPKCQCVNFEMKKEATYLYTYELDNPLTNDCTIQGKPLPFLFDKRDMLNSREYIECKNCGQQYFYDFANNILLGEFTLS